MHLRPSSRPRAQHRRALLGSAVLVVFLAAALPARAANAPPDTWFSGPDPALYPLHGNERYVDVANWNALPPLPDGFLNCDSLTVLPSLRPHRKTFYEIYGNRIYVRAENDTVSQNSWVVFTGGGSDTDSPYSVVVAPGDPALLDTIACAPNGPPWVVRPDGPNGSPIGFRSRVMSRLDPNNQLSVPSQSGLFPYYDPLSPFRLPMISTYWNMPLSGRAYAVLRAQDGEGQLDPTNPGTTAFGLADSVDLGLDTTATGRARRAKVLTFYVNRNPVLEYGAAAFVPKPPEFNGGQTWVFPASRILVMNLLSTNPDPFDTDHNFPPPGGPTPSAPPLVFTVAVSGRDAANQPVSYTAPGPLTDPTVTIDLNAAAPQIVSDDLTIVVNLCDCTDCATVPGQGRCVTYSIPARIDGPVGTLVSLLFARATPQRASLRWKVLAAGPVHVERATSSLQWEPLADRWPDANHEIAIEDATVTPGVRYGYRLRLDGGSSTEATWLDVPHELAVLALGGVHPNPGSGDRTLSFVLPDDRPATIVVFDASGRRVWNGSATGAGQHVLAIGRDFAPGLYLVRLEHGGRALGSKFAVVP